ncbi:hypothetical protein ELG63_36615 [Rhizobium leguminosarum]|uniref:hypothetical protein n=1 Tax=Rhizobium leguminosarum TaxID=384 RepID=UPI00103210EC|nr:hypothetical protein [Rhizobium leguminosarum]TBH28212.1 hypothetical protein ELG63_36615 [Rhizobium leguminosarum]
MKEDPTDDPGPPPRYQWRETWKGEGHRDYQAWDGPRSFGRIMLETNGTMQKQWRWSISHIDGVKRHLGEQHNGWQPSPRLAAQKVEDHYERLMQANGIPLNTRRS